MSKANGRLLVHEDVQAALQKLMWMDALSDQLIDERVIRAQVTRLRESLEAHLSKPPHQTWQEFWATLPGREMHQAINLKPTVKEN